jgi:hypothetical protein
MQKCRIKQKKEQIIDSRKKHPKENKKATGVDGR